jgi:predicted RNA-binding Zn-ribbon protein involved in translation (DUF1610 family)
MNRICPKCKTKIIKIDTNEYDGKEYTCIFCGYVIYEKKEKEK